MTEKVAAFFDLDRTLIDVNSGVEWTRYELKNRSIKPHQFARAMFWHALYYAALIDMDRAYDAAIHHYRGRVDNELREETRTWFEKEIRHRLRPGAQKTIAEHRQNQHQLILLTSVSSYEAQAARDAWQLDDWLANHFPTDNAGKLLGVVQKPICYGKGKVTAAEAWAKKAGIDLRDCYFYSDSLTDAPMLERVGYPRVVSPDPRLRRLAQKRSWPILSW